MAPAVDRIGSFSIDEQGMAAAIVCVSQVLQQSLRCWRRAIQTGFGR